MKGHAGDISNSLRLLSQTLGREAVKQDVLLEDYFSEVGASARGNVVVVGKESELVRLLEYCQQLKLPFVLLGQGKGREELRVKFEGLIIKNRVVGLKIVGLRGKVSSGGIGFVEATVEVGSGATLNELNSFLAKHQLKQVKVLDDAISSIGERLVWDIMLAGCVEKVKCWDKGDVNVVDFSDYRHKFAVVLSAMLRVKSNE